MILTCTRETKKYLTVLSACLMGFSAPLSAQAVSSAPEAIDLGLSTATVFSCPPPDAERTTNSSIRTSAAVVSHVRYYGFSVRAVKEK